MIQRHYLLPICLSILFLGLAPTQAIVAAGEKANETGVTFKVAYTDDHYVIFMQPNATPAAPNLTLTAQVTVKVPHGTGAQQFAVAAVQNLVADTVWTLTSRVDAPPEDPHADYLSFTVDFPTGNHQAYPWQADQEMAVFSFANSGACLGAVTLLENNDPFMGPGNSAGTNPGNQIDILGLREGNLYLGIYGGPADCHAQAATNPPAALFLPFVQQ